MNLDKILEVCLGQAPEAIYFTLFIVCTKKLNSKRLFLLIINITEYVMLFNVLAYNIWAHIIFFITEYLLLKILYKDEAQITDVFTLGIASVILIITSAILYGIFWKLTNNYLLYVVVHRFVLFTILCLVRNKLPIIQKVYKKLWNRDDTKRKPIKSTTFRALNVVLFNVSFFVINLGAIFMLIQKGGV